MLKPGDFDWHGIFGRGVRWFHSGGIFAALSETTSELIIEGMQAAKAAGAVVSFDLNYRAKLWASVGGSKRAHEVLNRIVEQRRRAGRQRRRPAKGSGHRRTRRGSQNRSSIPRRSSRSSTAWSKSTPTSSSWPRRLREVHSTNRHDWAAVLWLDGQRFVSPTCDLDVLDRIGGGDGFAAGFIYGLIAGRSPEEALRLGWAHGALLTTFPGDVTMAKLEEVEAFAKGGSARVQR